MEPGLNSLLKWSVENSSSTENDPEAAPPANRGFDPAALSSLFGGPSDADMMISSMTAILHPDPEVTLDDRLTAFDNFEQLIENLDNANNLGVLKLWEPLLSCLEKKEEGPLAGEGAGEIRMYAAWCIGTAVQNNEKSQQMALDAGAVEKLVKVAVAEGEGRMVRRKAVYALSSLVRNFQPAMDVMVAELGKVGRGGEGIDAGDMDAVDVLIGGLREDAAKGLEDVKREEKKE